VKFQLSLDASILEIEMYAYGIIEYFRYQQRERERENVFHASFPRLYVWFSLLFIYMLETTTHGREGSDIFAC